MPASGGGNGWRFTFCVLLTVLLTMLGNWDACRSGKLGNLWHNLDTFRSGEKETHPENVQFVIDFCRDEKITAIAISHDIGENRFVAQPLTEGGYPTVIKSSANVYVSYSTEVLPRGFVTLRTSQGLRIARRH